MRKIISLLASLLLVFLPVVQTAGAASPDPNNGQDTIVEAQNTDRVIVKLKQGASESVLKGMTIAKRGKKIKSHFSLKVPKGKGTNAFIKMLKKMPGVEYAEQDHLNQAAYTPSDPFYSIQWHLKKVGVDRAWEKTKGSSDMVVAVLDNGIELTHPDLKDQIVSPYDVVADSSLTIRVGGHGTHVAGIIAASMDNGQGGDGVAPNVKIMPINIFTYENGYYDSDAAEGIYHAVDSGAKIINMSLQATNPTQILNNAIQYAHQKGVIVVAAAGNSASSVPSYPASYPNVISVAALESNDATASFSNFGDNIDLAAPGSNIYSTYTGSWYTYLSGTSMAAPVVVGVAALVWSQHPEYTNDEVTNKLYETAVDLGEPGKDIHYGFGRVDAKKALGIRDLAAPVVKDISENTTEVTGTFNDMVEKGSVVVSNATEVIGTGDVQSNSTFSVVIPKQKPGTKLTVKVVDTDHNESPLVSINVLDMPPSKPTVTKVTDADLAITGTAEPGTYVHIIKSDGSGYIGLTQASATGDFRLSLATPLKANLAFYVVARDATGLTSDKVEATVQDVTPPAAPTVYSISDADDTVTGNAEAWTELYIRNAQGDVVGEGTVDTDYGYFSIALYERQTAGSLLSITVKDKAGFESSATVIRVDDRTPPDKPEVNPLGSSDTSITGKTEQIIKVAVYANGLKLGEAMSDGNGYFSIPIEKQEVGTEIRITATDAAGYASDTTVITVYDNTGPAELIVDEVGDSDTFITGKTEPYAKVEAIADGKTISQGIADDKGNYLLTITKLIAGQYIRVFATDQAGNTSGEIGVFVKDQTAPQVTGVVDQGAYNQDVTIAFDEGVSKLNGINIPSGTVVTGEGTYVLVVTDEAGNQVNWTFVIDKTAPDVTGVADRAYYNADRTVKFNEGTAILNGKAFTDGTVVSLEGEYHLLVTDAAGNKANVHFTIDKKAPIVSGVTNNAYYNKAVTVSFNEGVGTINGHALNSGTSVSSPGAYTIQVIDQAGNQTTVKFTIDKTAPKVSGVVNNGYYNKEMKVTFNGGKATLNGKAFVSGTLVRVAGVYTLVVTDLAGNKTTVKFTIDKTAPKVTGVANNAFYNRDIKINFNEGKATLNGKSFTNGTVVRSAGVYTLVVTDSAGNQTMVKFTIDKTPPAAPKVYSVRSTATTVSGINEAYSVITIKVGTKTIGTATTDKYGKFKVTIPRQKKKTVLFVTATDRAGNSSKTTKVIVY